VGEVSHIDTSPTYWWHRRDHAIIPPTQGVSQKSDTTFLPALYLQHASKLTQQTSAVAHVCTTAIGRPSSPTSQASDDSSTTRVRTSACSLASSSHSTGRTFTMTTERLTALPSLHTVDCLLVSTWDYAGNTRHATPRPRTPTTIFQNLGVKHRSTAQETSPRHHCLRTLWHVCRTTSTVRFSLFTPPNVPVITSIFIYSNHAFWSPCPLPCTLQHLRNNLREGVMWETPTWWCCFESGPAPTSSALAECGKLPSGAQLDSVPAYFRGFPPPGESRRSYTSLTTAYTPRAVRTPLYPVLYTRQNVFSVWTHKQLIWGDVFAHRYSPPHNGKHTSDYNIPKYSILHNCHCKNFSLTQNRYYLFI
jgi:hypothetical protein